MSSETTKPEWLVTELGPKGAPFIDLKDFAPRPSGPTASCPEGAPHDGWRTAGWSLFEAAAVAGVYRVWVEAEEAGELFDDDIEDEVAEFSVAL